MGLSDGESGLVSNEPTGGRRGHVCDHAIQPRRSAGRAERHADMAVRAQASHGEVLLWTGEPGSRHRLWEGVHDDDRRAAARPRSEDRSGGVGCHDRGSGSRETGNGRGGVGRPRVAGGDRDREYRIQQQHGPPRVQGESHRWNDGCRVWTSSEHQRRGPGGPHRRRNLRRGTWTARVPGRLRCPEWERDLAMVHDSREALGGRVANRDAGWRRPSS